MKATKFAAVCLSAFMIFGNLVSAGLYDVRAAEETTAEDTTEDSIVITEGTRIADNKLVYGDITYEIVDGNHLEVLTGKTAQGSVYIPLFISGLPVTPYPTECCCGRFRQDQPCQQRLYTGYIPTP